MDPAKRSDGKACGRASPTKDAGSSHAAEGGAGFSPETLDSEDLVLWTAPYSPAEAGAARSGDWLLHESELDARGRRELGRWWRGLSYQSWAGVQVPPVASAVPQAAKPPTAATSVRSGAEDKKQKGIAGGTGGTGRTGGADDASELWTTVLRVTDSERRGCGANEPRDTPHYFDLCWWDRKADKWRAGTTAISSSWGRISAQDLREAQSAVTSATAAQKVEVARPPAPETLRRGDPLAFFARSEWPDGQHSWHRLPLRGCALGPAYAAMTDTINGAVRCVDIKLDGQWASACHDLPAAVAEAGGRVTMGQYWEEPGRWRHVTALQRSASSPLIVAQVSTTALFLLAPA
jgi:hypothetical protein